MTLFSKDGKRLLVAGIFSILFFILSYLLWAVIEMTTGFGEYLFRLLYVVFGTYTAVTGIAIAYKKSSKQEAPASFVSTRVAGIVGQVFGATVLIVFVLPFLLLAIASSLGNFPVGVPFGLLIGVASITFLFNPVTVVTGFAFIALSIFLGTRAVKESEQTSIPTDVAETNWYLPITLLLGLMFFLSNAFFGFTASYVSSVAKTNRSPILCYLAYPDASDQATAEERARCLQESDPLREVKVAECATGQAWSDINCQLKKAEKALNAGSIPDCEAIQKVDISTEPGLRDSRDDLYQRCLAFATISTAVASGNPKLCLFDQAKQENNPHGWPNWDFAQGQCLANFVGTPEWRNNCLNRNQDRILVPGNTEYVNRMAKDCCINPITKDASVWDNGVGPQNFSELQNICRQVTRYSL